MGLVIHELGFKGNYRLMLQCAVATAVPGEVPRRGWDSNSSPVNFGR
jgi:hypothetical protein